MFAHSLSIDMLPASMFPLTIKGVCWVFIASSFTYVSASQYDYANGSMGHYN